ncbi:aspartate carbamoyltransferase catalytic subunit [Silvibacterium acidisoli]|uniref:aspartate carbamoyltransferase catalytic subunit n=1 Tax=Acidobacteriaceae bacterium ZG23-2 TaxID=2883246 RepID=UPI00406CD27C
MQAKTSVKTAGSSARKAKAEPRSSEEAPASARGNIHPGSLLSSNDLDLAKINSILALADELETENPIKRAERLFKRRVSLLFYESSTRTRTSFELAAKALGSDTSLVSALSSSIEKGESLKDTGITLKALGAECIILRSPYSGAPYLLAKETGLPILNGGDGMHEHPSQALLDLRTMLSRLKLGSKVTEKTLEGVTVTICGDIFHSRVARSNALLLPKLGARVILSGPQPLLPEIAGQIAPNLTIERDFNKALDQSQIVMMLRIQAERLAGLSLDLEEYKLRYQANAERIAAHAPKAVILHPGPMIRGLEITSDVADGPQSAIAEQVHHGLAVRMALIQRALGARSLKGAKR